MTDYTVFWWKESAAISKTVALDDTKFVIEDLLSNTAYHVVVMASGPLERVNSTRKVFYTTPEQIQGKVFYYFIITYIAILSSYKKISE